MVAQREAGGSSRRRSTTQSHKRPCKKALGATRVQVVRLLTIISRAIVHCQGVPLMLQQLLTLVP